MIRPLLLALGIVLSSAAAAQTGNDLLRDCRQSEILMNRAPNEVSGAILSQAGQCLGFLQGLRAGVVLESAVSRGTETPVSFCMPAAVTNGQQIMIALDWLRRNPADLHMPASFLLMLAYHQAFPCPK